MTKSLAQTLRGTAGITTKVESLDNPELSPSAVYRLLHGYSPLSIAANSLAIDSPTVLRNIQLFLNKLRFVRTALTGGDLKEMGIAPGPCIREIRNRLHEARLDGKVTSKREEEEMVWGLLDSKGMEPMR